MTIKLLIIYFIFATLGVGIYYIIPAKYRYIELLVLSLIAYIFIDKVLVLCIVATFVSTYFFGIWIQKLNNKYEDYKNKTESKDERKAYKQIITKKKKGLVALYIILNILILVSLKYLSFIVHGTVDLVNMFGHRIHSPIMNIAVPLGISYYTLQAISYVIDVYRGKYEAEKNFFKIALFVCFFPQLYEGPFNRYDKAGQDLSSGGTTDSDSVAIRLQKGIIRMSIGLFKLVVISYRAAMISGEVFRNYAQYSGFIVFCGIVCFTIQLYAEFSGLIDICSGVSKMFGVNMAQNFDNPFISQNVSEFWRRWHMSLGAWFRDYVFYPVSMSKGMVNLNKKLDGKVKPFWQSFIPTCLALLCVWSLTGLWHGASIKYLVYGLYYFVIMIISQLLEPLTNKIYAKTKINKSHWSLWCMRVIRTFILVCFGMLIFSANTLQTAFSMFGQLFHSGQNSLVSNGVIDIKDLILLIVSLGVFVTLCILKLKNIDVVGKLQKQNFWVKFVVIIIFIMLIIVFGAYGKGYVPPDPIYGDF